MKKGFLSIFGAALLAVPSMAQQELPAGVQALLAAPAQATEGQSPARRAADYSALAALPENTDSFFVLSHVEDWLLPLLVKAGGAGEMLTYAGLFDSVAMGTSPGATEDLQRLSMLGSCIRGAEAVASLQNAWAAQASPVMQRKMVGQQRKLNQEMLQKMLEGTENFHLAPVYLVLSGKAGSELLMHQLSGFPFMVPLEPASPLELVLKDSWRGFVLHANRLSLEDLGLPPEEEARLRKNLQDARVYFLVKAVGTKLVVALCSHPEELSIPVDASASVLASPVAARLDAYAEKRVYMAARSSAALMGIQRHSFLECCRILAEYMKGTFRSSAVEASPAEPLLQAADAISRLQEMLGKMLPPVEQPEWCFVLRKEDTVQLLSETDALGLRMEAAPLPCWSYFAAPDSMLYMGVPTMSNDNLPTLKELLEPFDAVAEGVAAQRETPEDAAVCRTEWGKVKGVLSALNHMCGTIGKSASLVWARHGESIPEALVFPVADKAAFEASFQELCRHAEMKIHGKTSGPDGISVYTLGEGVGAPLVTVADAAVAVGPDAAFNTRLVQPSPAPAIPGIVFRVNPGLLAESFMQAPESTAQESAEYAAFWRTLKGTLKDVQGAYSVHENTAILRVDFHLQP